MSLLTFDNPDDDVAIVIESPAHAHNEVWISCTEDGNEAGVSIDRDEVRQLHNALTAWLGEG